MDDETNRVVSEIANIFLKGMRHESTQFSSNWETSLKDLRPINALTNKPYRGSNAPILVEKTFSENYSDNRWVTERQAIQNRTPVKKEELNNGTPVRVFITQHTDKTQQHKQTLKQTQGMGFTLYNVKQLENYKVEHPDPRLRPNFDPKKHDYTAEMQRVDNFIKSLPVNVKEGVVAKNVAYFDPRTNEIGMPHKGSFEHPTQYYATLLHEVAHWVNKENGWIDETVLPGTKAYAKEEMRVEMSSYVTAQEFGVGGKPKEAQRYVNSYIEILENEPNEIISAAHDSYKISKFVVEVEIRLEREGLILEPNHERTKEIIKEMSNEINEGAAIIRGENVKLKDYETEIKQTEQQIKERVTNEKEHLLNRQYLAVGFDERKEFANKAKEAGASNREFGFDKERNNLWWINKEIHKNNKEKFKKFEPREGRVNSQKSHIDFVADVLQNEGIITQNIDMSGQKVRAGTIEKPKSRNAEYRVLFPKGNFTDQGVATIVYDRGQKVKMHWNKPNEATQKISTSARLANEAFKMNADLNSVINREINSETLEKIKEVAREKAEEFYKKARPHNSQHPYLVKKGINHFHNKSLKVTEENNLIIPVVDEKGKLISFQSIDEQGQKSFTQHNTTTGGKHKINEEKEGTYKINGEPVVFIVEGYATGITIADSLNNAPVHVAFNIYNLDAVAKQASEAGLKPIVIADNDVDKRIHEKDPQQKIDQAKQNLTRALNAAATRDGLGVAPKFTNESLNRGATDFNDLAQYEGKEKVAQQLRDTIRGSTTQLKTKDGERLQKGKITPREQNKRQERERDVEIER